MNRPAIENISLALLAVSPCNVRHRAGDVENLAESIGSIGLLQPIVVRPTPQGGYEVVAGSRRLEACRKLGWTVIPSVVRPLTDREALVLSLSENIQQETLDPIERAEGLQRLVEDLAKEMPRTQAAELAARQIGKNVATLYEWLALLRTTEAVRQMVQERKVEVKIAARLAALPSEQQEPIARVVAEENLTRAEAMRAVGYAQAHPDVPAEQAIAAFRQDVLQEYNLNVTLTGPIYFALAERAKRERCSVQELIRRAVQAYMQ